MVDFTPAITAVTTALAGLVVWLIQERRKTKALNEQKDGVLEQAMLVLIRDRLVIAHKAAVSKWTITIAEKQSFVELHTMYMALGGNGPASHLLEDLDRVKLVSD